MKKATLDMDGVTIHIKQDDGSTGEISIHIDIPQYDIAEGMYLSPEHAYILGRALCSIAKEDTNV